MDSLAPSELIQHVKCLYSVPAKAASSSKWLEEFQQRPEAWPVCVNILRDPECLRSQGQCRSEEADLVTYFAGSTLHAQGQTGFQGAKAIISNLSGGGGVEAGSSNTNSNESGSVLGVDVILSLKNCCSELLWARRDPASAGPTRRLISLTMADCVVFGSVAGEWPDAVRDVIQTFGESDSCLYLLVELLCHIIEELGSNRLALSPEQREEASSRILHSTPIVLESVVRIYTKVDELVRSLVPNLPRCGLPDVSLDDWSSTLGVIQAQGHAMSWGMLELMNGCLKALGLWRSAKAALQRDEKERESASSTLQMSQLLSPTAFEERDEKCLEIVGICLRHPMPSMQLVAAESFGVFFSLGLAKSPTVNRNIVQFMVEFAARVREFGDIKDTKEPVATLRLQVARCPDDTARAFCLLMEKFSKDMAPQVLSGELNNMESSMHELAETNLLFLLHPNIEIRNMALTFWEALLDLVISRVVHQATVSSLFHRLIDRILDAVEYLPESDIQQETAAMEAWFQFRAYCATALSDSTKVVSCSYVIDTAANRLKSLDLPSNWTQMEACLFVLSRVALRAPTVANTQIPEILTMLSTMTCSSDGMSAFFVRNAVASMAANTAVYIGTQPPLFASLFRRLTDFLKDLLRADKETNLSSFIVGDPDTPSVWLRQLLERVIVDALRSLASCMHPLFGESPGLDDYEVGRLMKDDDVTIMVESLCQLALETRYTLDSRCQLVGAAGSVLSFLPPDKRNRMHRTLVAGLNQKAAEDRASGAGVHQQSQSLKLVFTALETVDADFTSDGVEPDSPGHVPRVGVLEVLEEFWPTIESCLTNEEILRHGTDTDVVIDGAASTVVSICISARHVCHLYSFFPKFLTCLAQSFVLCPTVFHLSALRKLLGVFQTSAEPIVNNGLNEALSLCVLHVMERIKVTVSECALHAAYGASERKTLRITS
eukprot:GHVN01035353.1.p1 GENE.GHVN01035353.1~~GHVN01035353.1.p1  ORF type:complete len:946 (-),score=96.86 GHVN01035353.1:8257-11094(-)